MFEIVSWPFELETAVPFVSMIMVRSMSQTTERFNLCSANGFLAQTWIRLG